MRWLTLCSLLLTLSPCTGAAERAALPQAATPPLELALPEGLELAGGNASPVAVSPGGDTVVYAARKSAGPSRLYLQALDGSAARPLEGTEDASAPFFSPDGQWIGFFAGRELRKVRVDGGAPLTVTRLRSGPQGAAWAPDNTIVLTVGFALGLARVPADGGDIEVLSTPVRARGEMTHGWPHLLPDGESVLFTVARGEGPPRIAVLSLATREWHELDGLEAGTNPQYLESGHLVFANAGRLWLVPFDAVGSRVTGAPMPLGDDLVHTVPGGASAYFRASPKGTIVYVPPTPPERGRLVWVDRDGTVAPFVKLLGSGGAPRISPDGKRVAVDIRADPWHVNIWIFDVDGGAGRPLAQAPTGHIWSPDGTRLVFASPKAGTWDIYWTAADGSGPVEPLVLGTEHLAPTSWSPDGRILGFTEFNLTTGRDIWLWHADERTAEPLLRTPHDEYGPWFSPDGRWLAYSSNESGQLEVYVRPVRGADPTIRVSADGGEEPVWAPSGRELFYRNGEWIMAVDVAPDAALRVSPRRRLFSGAYQFNYGSGRPQYDVTPDGRRFLMTQNDYPPAPTRLRIVRNVKP